MPILTLLTEGYIMYVIQTLIVWVTASVGCPLTCSIKLKRVNLTLIPWDIFKVVLVVHAVPGHAAIETAAHSGDSIVGVVVAKHILNE